jgi:hypothetical protein
MLPNSCYDVVIVLLMCVYCIQSLHVQYHGHFTYVPMATSTCILWEPRTRGSCSLVHLWIWACESGPVHKMWFIIFNTIWINCPSGSEVNMPKPQKSLGAHVWTSPQILQPLPVKRGSLLSPWTVFCLYSVLTSPSTQVAPVGVFFTWSNRSTK